MDDDACHVRVLHSMDVSNDLSHASHFFFDNALQGFLHLDSRQAMFVKGMVF
jgi:hypothetical protein